MMIIEANTNKQKGFGFPLCFSSRTFKFSFTESCKYDSGDQQSDLHKIGGIAVFHLFKSFATTRTKKWWELHKWLSIRIGWRYNLNEDVFEITDYTYKDGLGERDTNDNKIVKVKVNEIVKITVNIKKGFLKMSVKTDRENFVTEILCNTPFFLCVPFFLRLRAYVGSGFTTNKTMIINEY